MSWDYVRLIDICTVLGGTTPSTKEPKYWDGDVIWLSPIDLPEVGSISYVTSSQRRITQLAVKENGLQILPIGSLVFSTRASIGKIGIVTVPLCTNQGFTNLIPGDKVDVKYLSYVLKNNIKQIEKTGNTTTFKEVSRSAFKEFKIPLPPIPIQKRIAEILDAADDLKRKDQQLLKKYDELAQSIFIDMFGDPVKNEKGWESNTVIDYCTCIVPGRDKPKSFTGYTPWITTDDLKHLNLTSSSKKNLGLTNEEIEQVNARVIPSNSVIMTCVGDLGIVSLTAKEMVINQQLHAFQCGTAMNPYFLMFNLSFQKAFMLKMASSTTLLYMNKTVCNSIPVICPPIDLQNEFELKIKNINSQLLKISHTGTNSLFETLIQKAFTGELVN